MLIGCIGGGGGPQHSQITTGVIGGGSQHSWEYWNFFTPMQWNTELSLEGYMCSDWPPFWQLYWIMLDLEKSDANSG